jgi:hypothetical protein
MDPVILASARRHGVRDDNMLHAYRNPIRVFEADDLTMLIPPDEYLLERATIARARSERQIVEAVTAARSKGLSWQRIGDILGTSAQAAQQRYGAAVESV